MQYIRVLWKHSADHDPVDLLSELNNDRWEIRKVDIYRDGSMGFADSTTEIGGSALGEVPTPSLEKIAADPQFLAKEITAEEFEEVWQLAVKKHKELPMPMDAEMNINIADFTRTRSGSGGAGMAGEAQLAIQSTQDLFDFLTEARKKGRIKIIGSLQISFVDFR